MARKRSKNKFKRQTQREGTHFADPKSVLSRYGFAFKKNLAFSPDIVEDLRRYDPTLTTHRRLIDGSIAKIALSKASTKHTKTDPTRARLSFINPRKTVVCRKRRKRRKVLFSTGGIGKGIKIYKKFKRLTEDSKIKC